ncbi:zinc finger and SCAN domain-containing protein 32 isoform X2 [Dendroctonus ponderosae]|uniref:zinc finger and SCAN domain-containing protein 32 isoform X2 n=1 Tax=Dendroctonus ponderosae TaxID=77166 RepID=UPI002036344C|nr:zinc finger and SCAN domain-containing protein 32 isoform X2 [Dendroctonus ponderosae]
MSTLVVNTKFDELCRLCGSKTDSLAVHIFEDEGTFSELENKILGCLQIQINQQDELPKQLCDHCLVKLEMFWDFKDRSLRTEQLLIELLKQLKNAEDAQCFVSVDPEGMVLQGQSLSNMAEPEHAFNLIPQQILNQVSMVEDGTLYSSDNYSKPPGNADQLTCYSNQNLDENSLSLTEFQPQQLLSMPNFLKFGDNFETNTDAAISFTESQLVKSEELSMDSSDCLSSQDDSAPKLANPATEVADNSDLSNMSPVLSNMKEEVPPEKQSVPKPANGKICPECGKSYRSNYKLAEHMTMHTGEKKHKCQMCEKRFRSKMGLAQHEAKHTGQYDLRCPVCGKGFQCRSYLMVHQRVCGKGFMARVDLRIHLTMHTGEKSFVCEMCGKAFARRDALKCHRRMHTGERPYSCDICGRTFTQFTPMANHKRNHHSDSAAAQSTLKVNLTESVING